MRVFLITKLTNPNSSAYPQVCIAIFWQALLKSDSSSTVGKIKKVLQANLPHSFQECLCKIDGNKDIFLLPIDSQFTITTKK
jgi:hypothetical protein